MKEISHLDVLRVLAYLHENEKIFEDIYNLRQEISAEIFTQKFPNKISDRGTFMEVSLSSNAANSPIINLNGIAHVGVERVERSYGISIDEFLNLEQYKDDLKQKYVLTKLESF